MRNALSFSTNCILYPSGGQGPIKKVSLHFLQCTPAPGVAHDADGGEIVAAAGVWGADASV